VSDGNLSGPADVGKHDVDAVKSARMLDVRDEFKTHGPESPDGTPWWLVRTTPGTRRQPFGGVKRIAAYLNFEVEVGEHFTMRQLRQELGQDGVAETAEHFNRRLRELRPDGWQIPRGRMTGIWLRVSTGLTRRAPGFG
jgi:hypothetical protein